jgi:hypothetical protein
MQKLVDYAAGKLTKVEMHMVERHLTDCAMCSDALDGILQLENPNSINSVMAELNAAIDQRAKRSSAISFSYAIRVAASLLVLLSISILTYNYFSSLNSSYTLAENLHRKESVWAGKQLFEEQPFTKSTIRISNSRPGAPANRSGTIITPEATAMAQPMNESSMANEKTFDTDIASDDTVLEEVVVIGYATKMTMTTGNTMDSTPTAARQASSVQTTTLSEATATKKVKDETTLKDKSSKMTSAKPLGETTGNGAERANSMHNTAIAMPTKEQHENEVFLIAEEMPFFNAEGYTSFNHFIASNINLHLIKQGQSTEVTTVFVEFIVEPDGRITNAKALRNENSNLEAEALRVIMLSPKWTPGKQRGVPVRVALTYPIKFDFQQ